MYSPKVNSSDWQVVLERNGVQGTPMNLSEAKEQGYMFHLTDRRFVFRTPYEQPDSFNTEVIMMYLQKLFLC